MEFGVIGDEQFVMGFKLLGIKKSKQIANNQEFEDYLIDMFKDKDVGIIIIQPEYYKNLSSKTKLKVDTSLKPTVIVLGEKLSDILRDKIKHVIGVDLWGN
ncbi:MAG: V-type ATP synthase subunit F [Candidatus Methanofastidiosum methylothiophilum]|uniref:A-type ATP synthase subunit F n=1 Tax=Candidatus Methanofastidiosum methylothiophilum TaxID=1705564 RepID=A0A150IKM3_9EURY|nr:MAG: V-type ATP synthase subunit F [Candidatus Methanofastidiosum methylthiophilus]KYC47704.1 MAG: V-type ATP synthase subunit F [Candidatus Methanofastidiosum methylthiophilus]KYC50290.1 MAG: V-type ATP synthase subunit F [Candidatus Methanofastidiosum methylthiophilus]